jgi:GMP synthase (glutamine-hydrolysing)
MGHAEYTEIVLPEMRTIERHPSFEIRRSRGTREKKILLLQARNWYDPMIGHEVHCFRERIPDDYELACYNIVSGPWDESVLDGFSAVMVGGSGDYGSAYNDNPWFSPALELLRRVVERDIPLFCSCWGHQALAVALGGKVEIDEDGYELGVLELELTEQGTQDPLFGSLPKRFRAPLGHSEQVTKLPEGAQLLASTPRCHVQAYRLGNKPVYSCQFHPELTSSQLWERVDAYIPQLRGQKRGHEPTSTDKLIAEFLSAYLK